MERGSSTGGLPLFDAVVDERAAEPSPPAVEKPRTVHELTLGLKRLIESNDSFKDISIIGEISNFKHHLGKHMYFSLKDEGAQIACVFFSADNRTIGFKPADGMEVVLRGSVSIYPQQGKYQFYVSSMTESGSGVLWRKFEELKKKLAEEGLTARERKRPLPKFPRAIGIVSSQESAGLRDMLNVLSRRYPLVKVILEPVAVEGESSAPSIAAGLRRMARFGEVDLVIVGRGGGSIESLWGFNTELVARAIAEHPVPVISAVGHETDTTIADLVADRRAATPTEAAELATPSADELRTYLAKARRRLVENAAASAKKCVERCALTGRALRSPDGALKLRLLRVDRCRESLDTALGERFAAGDGAVRAAERTLAGLSPRTAIADRTARLAALEMKAEHCARRAAAAFERRASILASKLEGINPTAVLKRGYAVVSKDGRAVRRGKELSRGDTLSVRFHAGSAACEVIESSDEVR